ncbi:hypothetical protein P8C59_009012 [Phyllachora maydis]|uniref:Uncharacterized protein n=1 Tax=Phyllachora maydis TaxID=1825666 RepID=A0AAD9MJ71_9PEZI|nr:hypothetical protein P8C59_009012 [Phyllachora maydis]
MVQSLMARLWGLAPKHVAPPPVPTDTVYPVHSLDDTAVLRSVVVTCTLHFDAVLDPDVLAAGLTGLLSQGDWRKLGGRLRLRPDGSGRLEVHTPAAYTAARPAAAFSRQVFAVRIAEHPLAARLPRPTARGPSVHRGGQVFRPFAARPDVPARLDDYLYSDAPLLSVHVTLFDDATLVGFCVPHVLSDGMGMAAMVAAWSLVLAGRAAEVPPVLGARQDVLAGVGDDGDDKAAKEFVLEDQKLGVWGTIRMILGLLWELYWYPEMEQHIMCLPPSFLARLRRQAEEDLRAEGQGEDGPAFVTDGDLISAWGTRMIMDAEPGARPAVILNALDVRPKLPGVVRPAAEGVYVQNLVVSTFTTLTAAEAWRGSLGGIAVRVRRSLAEQTTPAQARRMVGELRPALAGTGFGLFFGDPSSRLVILTNWTKMNVFEAVDFGPAVVKARPEAERTVAPGRVVGMLSLALAANRWTRHMINVAGKDKEGNTWINAWLAPGAWRNIERDFAATTSA